MAINEWLKRWENHSLTQSWGPAKPQDAHLFVNFPAVKGLRGGPGAVLELNELLSKKLRLDGTRLDGRSWQPDDHSVGIRGVG